MKDQDIEYFVIHTSATKPSMRVNAEVIRQWHMTPPRNWSNIGYHLVITREGMVEPGRPLWAPGAHAKGVNTKSWGICMVGGLDEGGEPVNNYTERQFALLKGVLTQLWQRAPQAKAIGHRDLSPDLNNDGTITPDEWVKVCPCFNVHEWVSQWTNKNG